MARLRFTEQFVDDAALIWSPRVKAHLLRILDMLESFPEAGSPTIPQVVKREFGEDVRVCALTPFDLVYLYEQGSSTVILLGLVLQKRAY